MLQETPAEKNNYTTPGEIEMNESSMKNIEMTHERLHGDSGQVFLANQDMYSKQIQKKNKTVDDG